MKQLLFAIIGVSLSVGVFAQSGKYYSAYNYVTAYQQSEMKDTKALLDAKEEIEPTVTHEKTALWGKAWFYRGWINHMIYENQELSAQYPDALLVAAESYQKALSLGDPKFKDEDKAKAFLFSASIQLFNQGVGYYQEKLYDKALACFKEVIAIKEFTKTYDIGKEVDAEKATFNAALSANNLGRSEEAEQLMKDLITSGNGSAGAYQTLAQLYRDSEKTEEALKTLQEGIEKFPNELALRIDELNIYLEQGRETEAVDKLKAAIELDPENHVLYSVLANAYTTMGDYNSALANYEKAIEINPSYLDAYNNIGAMYLDKANKIIEEMNSLSIKEQDKYDRLSKERDAIYAKALPYLEKAKELNPTNLEVLYALKEIYAKMGEYEKSKEIKAQIDAQK